MEKRSSPSRCPSNIHYEDGDIMIINKPPGMVVHPAIGNYTGTLIDGVAWYLRQKNACFKRTNPSTVRPCPSDRQEYERPDGPGQNRKSRTKPRQAIF